MFKTDEIKIQELKTKITEILKNKKFSKNDIYKNYVDTELEKDYSHSKFSSGINKINNIVVIVDVFYHEWTKVLVDFWTEMKNMVEIYTSINNELPVYIVLSEVENSMSKLRSLSLIIDNLVSKKDYTISIQIKVDKDGKDIKYYNLRGFWYKDGRKVKIINEHVNFIEEDNSEIGFKISDESEKFNRYKDKLNKLLNSVDHRLYIRPTDLNKDEYYIMINNTDRGFDIKIDLDFFFSLLIFVNQVKRMK